MVIIELIYKKDFAEIDKYLERHRSFLDEFYENGTFLASGPQNPRVGGIIIALCNKIKAEEIIAKDPFYTEGVAEYTVIEFDPVKFHKELSKLVS